MGLWAHTYSLWYSGPQKSIIIYIFYMYYKKEHFIGLTFFLFSHITFIILLFAIYYLLLLSSSLLYIIPPRSTYRFLSFIPHFLCPNTNTFNYFIAATAIKVFCHILYLIYIYFLLLLLLLIFTHPWCGRCFVLESHLCFPFHSRSFHLVRPPAFSVQFHITTKYLLVYYCC